VQLQLDLPPMARRQDHSAADLSWPLGGRKASKNNIRVASFFSGCGGLDIGFHLAGFDIVYATDLEPLFCQTLEANREAFLTPETVVAAGDIRELPGSSLPKSIDFVVGGPPCQSFSASGRRAGGAAGQLDQRGTLFQAYRDLIAKIEPRGFLFENVRGILGTNKGADWRAIVDAFRSIGYDLYHRLLDACDYGVPQRRERMFLVGLRSDLKTDFLFPAPWYGPDSGSKRGHRSPADCFIDLQQDEDPDALVLRDGRYSHLLPEVPPGENYLHFTHQRGYPRPVFAYRSRFSDFLYKAHPERPVKTLIASPGKYTGPLHWENRYFTTAEYKRLQGFPDNYMILGNRTERIRQIGNSVSPAVAFAMASAIASQVFEQTPNVPLLKPDAVLSFDQRKSKQAQQTRQRHLAVASRRKGSGLAVRLRSYRAIVQPGLEGEETQYNVVAKADGLRVKLAVRAGASQKVSARMRLVIAAEQERLLWKTKKSAAAVVDVSLFGDDDHSIQTMWNAVDDLVIRCSNFHSLIELYGHFTEPHPLFAVEKFELRSSRPVMLFAKHIADFGNCSKYFPKSHLVKLFGKVLGVRSFIDIAERLRQYRFDIRSQETNIAMPESVYMVAYPFTLPSRKQMNFRVRTGV
jgi:DNA (cytosine-5)-methyltransferase 1